MATFLRSRAVIGVNGGAAPALLTHYWDSAGAAVGLLATEAVARVRAACAALTTVIGSNCIYTPTLLVDEIEETNGNIVNQVLAGAPAALAFTGAGSLMPLQTQLVAQYQTGLFLNGRRVRGRSYIPGIVVGAGTAGGNPAPATLTALGAFNAALGTTIITPMTQRVWHRPNSAGVGGLSAAVTTRTAGASFGVMRSRRR